MSSRLKTFMVIHNDLTVDIEVIELSSDVNADEEIKHAYGLLELSREDAFIISKDDAYILTKNLSKILPFIKEAS